MRPERHRAVLGLLLLLAPSPSAGNELRFTDVSKDAGVTAANMFGGVRAKSYILETTGTGAAFFDYDEDGDADLFLVNGTRLGYGETQSVSNVLYRNDGEGRFRNVTAEAGLESYGWGQGVASSDVDNDGDADLLVTYYGRDRFYRNNGDGTFTESAGDAGLDDEGWGTSAAFADFDSDGVVDLFVAKYVDFDIDSTPAPGEAPNCFFMGIPVMCGPKGLTPARSRLYRGRGDGTFADVSGAGSGVGVEPFYGLGAVWGDVDNDSDLDLYVANDQTPNSLFRNEGDGRFENVALHAGVAYNEDGRAQAGMGVDLGDFDNDGWLDAHVTNFSHDHNTLYRNTGLGFFLDESYRAGVGEPSYPYLGWGTGFADLDRDGFLDLVVVNGHVYPEVDTHDTDSEYAQRPLLFHNLGDGTFTEVGVEAGLESKYVGRGIAFADVDDDGDVDALVTAMNSQPALLRNDSDSAGTWLGFRLIGRRSVRDAVGARVVVTTNRGRFLREVKSGASYLSQSELRLHFGLGSSKVERIDIRWPSGAVQSLSEIPLERYTTMVEP